MPLRHSCRAVLRIPKRENRAAQYRAASHQQTADSRTDTIKAACTPFPKVQAAFCAVYQIRCSQLSTVSSIWLFKWRLSRLAKSFFSGV